MADPLQSAGIDQLKPPPSGIDVRLAMEGSPAASRVPYHRSGPAVGFWPGCVGRRS
jgi:hypothetical protein